MSIDKKEPNLLPPHMPRGEPPTGAILADISKLDHINTYGDLPSYYVDYDFVCKDCGVTETWKAEQQKWYYEESKGHIWAVAIRCHDCRKKRNANYKPIST